MDDDEIWRHIDEQRADLADFLDTLTPEQWETPSLCDGWTVRDVAAHVTQSTTALGARFGCRDRAVGLSVRRDGVPAGARGHRGRREEITAALRAMVGGRRSAARHRRSPTR